MMLALLVVSALLLAYANGSNDNFKATATLFGSNTLDYRQALTLATTAQIAGSMASVLLATTLVKAFSGKGLVPPEVVGDPGFLVAVGVGSAATVLVATRLGIPVSTTHAMIGGLVGAAGWFAPAELAWGQLGAKYFVPLLVSPVLALVGAAALYPVARGLRRGMGITETTCLCVGPVPEPVRVGADGTMSMVSTGRVLTVDDAAACVRTYDGMVMGVSAARVVDGSHVLSGLSLGFARGLNDTPKVLALVVAAGWSGIDPRVSLAVVAGAMALGGVLHARRVAETLGHRITDMNRGQGLLANATASTLVIGASLLGSPVSTTHVSTGAIFGIGMHSGRADWRVAGGIVAAWVLTLPLAAALSISAAWLLGGVSG